MLQNVTKARFDRTGGSSLPVFSPDGKQIAFAATPEGASAPDLFVINADGTNMRRLTTHPDSDTTPIARYADSHVVTLVASPSFLNSYVAPMAAITAIHVACAHIDPKSSLTRLRPTDREYASGTRWYRDPKSNNHK